MKEKFILYEEANGSKVQGGFIEFNIYHLPENIITNPKGKILHSFGNHYIIDGKSYKAFSKCSAQRKSTTEEEKKNAPDILYMEAK